MEQTETATTTTTSSNLVVPTSSVTSTWKYVEEEENFKSLLPSSVNPATATDFVFVPYTLERMIWFGMLICCDSFLFVFCILPLRGIIALSRLIRKKPLHPIQRVDLLKISLILLGYLALRLFHIPSLTGFIRQESLLKLKIFFTLLELMDHLLCSYGENILGSLYWVVNQPPERVARGYWWHWIWSVIYVTLHSSFLLFHLSVLNVAINSKSNTLLTLLILVQFAEMKSAVLKKISKKKLQDMCAGDIVERFQLVIYLVLLFFYNIDLHGAKDSNQPPLWSLLPPVPVESVESYGFWVSSVMTYPQRATQALLQLFSEPWMFPLLVAISIVYFSELIVDWLKHTSIINYTGLSPHLYTDISYKFSVKLVDASKSSIFTDRTNAVFRKMGLMPLALCILVLRIMGAWMPPITSISFYLAVILIWTLLFLLRICTGKWICLMAQRHASFRNRTTTYGKLFLRVSSKANTKFD